MLFSLDLSPALSRGEGAKLPPIHDFYMKSWA